MIKCLWYKLTKPLSIKWAGWSVISSKTVLDFYEPGDQLLLISADLLSSSLSSSSSSGVAFCPHTKENITAV